ncbi:ABC transporter permease [Pseudoglutamicibacter cumminsii]|uniref:ABC transporter permease n=1 Tax=Pseudoglutamicibacter cumminsii TaxID=156979 RepID=UPI001EF8DD1B|nr:ABC transporter permease [Pseudoglutamicibacter cumminsii]MBM7796203.1 putative ABC transport system permease protein [Pseudoglutamicibacter cumminsii]
MFFSDMLAQLPSGTELGLIYGIAALGVYLTFRVLGFPDLTVDGSFTTGGATAAAAIVAGVPPWLAVLMAFGAGAIAGSLTGILHTKGKIDGLLASIIMMIALYSINLHIMGNSAAMPLLGQTTMLTPLEENGLLRDNWAGAGLLLIGVLAVAFVLIWFLHTRTGLALRATGNNSQMATSFRVNTDNQKILGLAISNGLVAVSGAFLAQYQSIADATMGIGLIVIGLASVIVGQAICGQRRVWQAVLACIAGSILYRWVLQIALGAGLPASDMKLASAVLVVIALLLPRLEIFKKMKGRKLRREQTEAEAGLPDDADTPAKAKA